LELGSSTTGPIIKQARIASGKAYLVLDKLASKGLVTHITKANVRYFQPTDPQKLIDYMEERESALKEKEEALKTIVPSLRAKYEERKYQSRAEVYEGTKGFKAFYDWTLTELKEGDCINILGVSGKALERFDAYLIDWNERRIRAGIRMRIIYNQDARPFGKIRQKMRLTYVRYMKKNFETPAWIDIFRDYVVTIDVHAEPVCFLIKNKESAESYNKYFEMIWNLAER
jgi:sugar-specific transcriptional regulator TrmB